MLKRFRNIPNKPVAGGQYFIIIPYAWGKGPTFEVALKNVRRSTRERLATCPVVVYQTSDDDAYVSDFGGLHARSEPTKIYEEAGI